MAFIHANQYESISFTREWEIFKNLKGVRRMGLQNTEAKEKV